MARVSAIDKLPPQEKQEILELIKNKESTYAEIAKAYGLNTHVINNYVSRTLNQKKRNKPKKDALETLEQEYKTALAEKKALELRIFEIKEKIEEKRIFFELDGDELIVHGIGEEIFKAEIKSWLRFLNLEGARKLRDFIYEHIKDKNHDSFNPS